MLSEGRRDGLRLSLSRSLSEPGVSAPQPAFLVPPPTPHALSHPSSPCTPTSSPFVVPTSSQDTAALQHSVVLLRARVMEPVDLARRLTRGGGRPFVVADVRSFVSYNAGHVKSAVNISCGDRLSRRRLLHRRAGLGVGPVGLATSSREGREASRRRAVREVVVYDENSSDLHSLAANSPLVLVLAALIDDNREPIMLKGGFQAFESSYAELCEDALMPPRSPRGAEIAASGDDMYPPAPLTPETAVESAPLARVLPFLYLGNAKDAANRQILDSHGICHVLNVTSTSCVTEGDDRMRKKSLPALDSAQQNLRQYFEEAIDYIESARRQGGRVLVHCEAGVSRSPTIVLAYLMQHTRISMLDAYKLLKTARPVISPNLNFMGQLVEWEKALQASRTEVECTPCHQRDWRRHDGASGVPNACHV